MSGCRCLRKVRRRMFPLVALGVFWLLLVGCSSPDIYSWGKYEKLVYASYANPPKVTAAMQVARMEEDYKKACAKNQRVPPGFHAQLGYLYSKLGRTDAAREQFEKEKTEFPESAVFVDHVVATLGKHETAAK